MISSVNGKLVYVENEFVVVECSGVGFKCFVTRSTAAKLPPVGEQLFLHTYLSVKEDSIDLYGFYTTDEIRWFKLVTSVNSVGAKTAMAILSEFTPEKLMLHIASNDSKALTRAQGVGLKTAQRIILELKDKIGPGFTNVGEDVAAAGNAMTYDSTREAVSALVSLGFSQSDASIAVGRLDATLSTEDLIKNALKSLTGQV